jgi:hypothetical protein
VKAGFQLSLASSGETGFFYPSHDLFKNPYRWGQPGRNIKQARGQRQGDLLSLFLFILDHRGDRALQRGPKGHYEPTPSKNNESSVAEPGV